MQDKITANDRQDDELKAPSLTPEDSRVSPLKDSNGEEEDEKPTSENNFEQVGQLIDEKRSQNSKEPSRESNAGARRSPSLDKQLKDAKSTGTKRPSERPSRFSYSVTRRGQPQAPRATTSPSPSSKGQKVSPPASTEKQKGTRIGNKRADKFKLIGRDRLGGKLSQHGGDEVGDSRKQLIGTRLKEKAAVLREETLDDDTSQVVGKTMFDEPSAAFTGPVPKVEQRFSRSRGPSMESTPKRDLNGTKGTYRAHLMNRAKGRIADELLVQYDVYFEKYRDFYCEDPAIPRCVRRPVQAAWDYLSPHVRNEYIAVIEEEIGLRQKRRETLDQEIDWLKKHAANLQKWPALLRSGWLMGDRIRNSILYAYYPYDKTSWGMIQNPLWWVLFCFRAFPTLGINSMSFAVTLLMIDRHDHFQLVQFILDFKKYQFLINGILMLCYFSAHYSFCVIRNETEDCGKYGPGNYSIGPGLGPNVLFLPSFVGFVLQIILVWIGLYLLQYSISKGGTVRQGERLLGDTVQWKEDHPDPKKQWQIKHTGTVIAYDRKTGLHTVELISGVGRKRGDRENMTVQVPLHQLKYYVAGELSPLRHLLFYDLACFLIVCALALAFLIYSHQDGSLKRQWQYRSTFVAAQIGYSLSTVPFLFASLPPWSIIVTHARRTGYTQNGVCVPMMVFQQFDWVTKRAFAREVQKKTAKKLPLKRFRNVKPPLEGRRGWFKSPQALPKSADDVRGRTPASNPAESRGRFSRQRPRPRHTSLDALPTAAKEQVEETPHRSDRVSRMVSEMGEAVLPPLEEATGTVVTDSTKGAESNELYDLGEADDTSKPFRPLFGLRFDDMIVRMPKNAKPGDIVEFEVKRTGHKARITLPPESNLGGKINVKVPHPPSFCEPPGGSKPTDEVDAMESLWDEMVVRLPRKARPGDTVTFEVTKTGQHARITVPEGARPRQAVQVKVPKRLRPPPRLGPEPPSVGNVYEIKLISSHQGSRSGAYLDAHRSFRRDERSMDSTFVLAHDQPVAEESVLQKPKAGMSTQWNFFNKPTYRSEGLRGSWLLEALSPSELEAARAVPMKPGSVPAQAFFRMKCLTGHYGCPDGGYLCGVASDANVPSKGATEAKFLRRDDTSTWAFIQPLESQDTTLGPCTSYIWALEPSDEHTGEDGRWKLRLVTSALESPNEGNYYLEVHRELVKGVFKDARSHLSTYVHVHKETLGTSDFAGDWIFEGVTSNELV